MASIYCKPSQLNLIKLQYPDLEPIFAEDGTMLTTYNKRKSKSCTIIVTLSGLYFYRMRKHYALLKHFFSIYDIKTIQFIDPIKSKVISKGDKSETFTANHMGDILSKLSSALSLLTGNFRDHPNISFEGFPFEPRITSLPLDHLNLSVMRYICLCDLYKPFDYVDDISEYIYISPYSEPMIETFKNIETTPNQTLTLSQEVTGISIIQTIAEPISFIDNITTVRFINFIPFAVFNLAHYLLKHSKSIRTIIFENYNFLIPYQLDLDKLTNVNTPISFIFNNCNIDQENTLKLHEVLAKYPGEYQRLSFNQLSLNAETCSSLFENLTKSRAARTLECFEMTQIEQDGDIVETFNNGVQSLLRHCRSLYYISFSFTQNGIPLQLDPFFTHYTLSEIVLTKQNFTQPFMESLDLPPQLHYLDLSQSKFSFTSLQSLLSLISKHENPLSLSLAQMELSESGWMQFYDALPTLPTLRCLREFNWSGNKIMTKSMEQFVQYFIKETPIRYLSIDYIFGISQMDEFKNFLSFIPQNKLWGVSIKGNPKFNFSSNFPPFLAAMKTVLPIHFLNLDGQLIREDDFPTLCQFLKENECIIGLSCDDIQNKQPETFFYFYNSLFSTQLKSIGRPMVDLKVIFNENSIIRDKLYENVQWQTFRHNIRTKYNCMSPAMRAMYICLINTEEEFNIQHYIKFVTTYPKNFISCNYIDSYGVDFISPSNSIRSIFEINNKKTPFVSLSNLQNKNLIDALQPPNHKKLALQQESQISLSSLTSPALDPVSKSAPLDMNSFKIEGIGKDGTNQKEEIYIENDEKSQPFTEKTTFLGFQEHDPINRRESVHQSKNEFLSSEELSNEQDGTLHSKGKQIIPNADELSQKVQELENTIAELKMINSNMINEISHFKSENLSLQKLASKTRDLEKENSRLKSKNSSLQKLASKITELEKENSQLKTENSSLQKLASKSTDLEKENHELKAYLFALKEKIKDPQTWNIGDYKEGDIIGKGATSTVKEIIKNEKYAKKELQQFDHKTLQGFLKESEILVKLRHPSIVRIVGFDFGDSSHPPSIFLSLEPSSLENSIKKHELSNEDKNLITVEIVLGMRYIHSNNLMHRDLKPDNILLSQNKHVRISDFGLTKEDDLSLSQSKGVGTLRFMAPELFKVDENGELINRYNNKIDVYSFGIILIYIITEKYPTDYINILNGALPKLPSAVASWVVELIHQCLQVSADNRPTFNEIFEILKSHNFDLFEETHSTSHSTLKAKSQREIEQRVLKITAFEYQHTLKC